MKYEPKPLFLERMRQLLPDENDFSQYIESLKTESVISIRCNTLKIRPDELKKRLQDKGWKIKQPFSKHAEIMIIEGKLLPGELGRSLEHQLGYFYVQDIASMLSIIALEPKPHERILDLCASPGSKTTYAASYMNNNGLIIANDKTLDRIQILGANLERCGVSNTIMIKKDGIILCERLKMRDFKFDKILLDAPCSGEGTFRNSPKGMLAWNIMGIRTIRKLQKKLLYAAYSVLKQNGILIYSTCTHAPEEDEEVVEYAVKELHMSLEKTSLPVKSRQGLNKWGDQAFDPILKDCCRIYPQDNNTEGFFIARLRK